MKIVALRGGGGGDKNLVGMFLMVDEDNPRLVLMMEFY